MSLDFDTSSLLIAFVGLASDQVWSRCCGFFSFFGGTSLINTFLLYVDMLSNFRRALQALIRPGGASVSRALRAKGSAPNLHATSLVPLSFPDTQEYLA